jgi:ribosomal protein S24E
MKIKINQKEDNPLLERVEFSGTVEFDGATPSNIDVLEAVAKELKLEQSLVVIKHLHTRFSGSTADVDGVGYSSKEIMLRVEHETKHLRKKAEEGKKAAEAKKAEEAKVAEARKAEEAKVAEAKKVAEAGPESSKPAEEDKAEDKEGDQ